LIKQKNKHTATEVAGVKFSDFDSAPVPKFLNLDPVASEISDVCEISDLDRDFA